MPETRHLNSFIVDIGLAEEMAYAERPHRELALHAKGIGKGALGGASVFEDAAQRASDRVLSAETHTETGWPGILTETQKESLDEVNEGLLEQSELGYELAWAWREAITLNPILEEVVITEKGETGPIVSIAPPWAKNNEFGIPKVNIKILDRKSIAEEFGGAIVKFPDAVTKIAEQNNVRPEDVTAEFLYVQAFIHELGHAIEFAQYAGNPEAHKDEKHKQTSQLPIGGAVASRIMQPGDRQREFVENNWEAIQEKLNVGSIEELVAMQGSAHRDMEFEHAADLFAADVFALNPELADRLLHPNPEHTTKNNQDFKRVLAEIGANPEQGEFLANSIDELVEGVEYFDTELISSAIENIRKLEEELGLSDLKDSTSGIAARTRPNIELTNLARHIAERIHSIEGVVDRLNSGTAYLDKDVEGLGNKQFREALKQGVYDIEFHEKKGIKKPHFLSMKDTATFYTLLGNEAMKEWDNPYSRTPTSELEIIIERAKESIDKMRINGQDSAKMRKNLTNAGRELQRRISR